MRSHLLVGIVGSKEGDPPLEHVDYMLSFDPPVLAISYCPFCGKKIEDLRTLRTVTRIG